MPPWILRALDHFVPPARKTDEVELRQGRLLVAMLGLVLLTVPWNSVVQLYRGHWALLGVSTTTIALHSAALLAYRRYDNHALISQLLLAFGALGIWAAALLSGLLYSPVTPIFAAVPLVALALIGERAVRRWTVVSITAVLSLTAAELAGFSQRDMLLQFFQPVPVTLNLLLLVGYIAGIGYFLQVLNEIQRQQVEQARRAADEARAAADAANAAKSSFLANMSHELRTPMNGVLGLAEVLLHGKNLTEAQRLQLRTIHESGRTLVSLLNDILDLSKVESGHVQLDELPWAVPTALEEVRQLFGQSAARKGLVLRTRCGPEVPPLLLGDPARVRQVLLNLVGNAIKFTAAGEVELSAALSGPTLRLSVRDTGIGVDVDAQQRIFEPFTQADSSTSRRHGGTGLGLAICSRLVGLMGGRIELQSAPGLGSRFTVCLPLRPAPPGTAPPADPAPVGPPPDVLPGGSAPLPAPDGPLPAPEGPPPPDAAPTNTPAAPAARAVAAKPRCLLVEDVAVNQVVATMMMERLGFSVEVVDEGPAALSRILEGDHWDIILMDWQLPGMDGLEVTRRARAAGVRLRIVGVTANVRAEDREAGLAAGMDDFVGKPYTLDQLQRAVRGS
ncbi:MAG: response regulator [Deltaproteobacteria bacterium]|nr:response regulator [Deltaproteobacteria bacterium]